MSKVEQTAEEEVRESEHRAWTPDPAANRNEQVP
jgi:hypothetical protein